MSLLNRFSYRFNRICCLLLMLGVLSACQSQPLPSADRAALDHLLALIQQRLAVAPLVARVKWNTHGAVNDPV